jgi:hypothetical protein
LFIILTAAKENEVVVIGIEVVTKTDVIDLYLIALLIQQVTQNFNIPAVAISVHEILIQISDFDRISHGPSASVFLIGNSLPQVKGKREVS